jgi:hypothetical protein
MRYVLTASLTAPPCPTSPLPATRSTASHASRRHPAWMLVPDGTPGDVPPMYGSRAPSFMSGLVRKRGVHANMYSAILPSLSAITTRTSSSSSRDSVHHKHKRHVRFTWTDKRTCEEGNELISRPFRAQSFCCVHHESALI